MSRGGRGLLATPAGAVACELEPLGIDASGARYELRVTNGTGGSLQATASAMCAGDHRAVAALAVDIEPHRSIRTGFTLDPALAYERVAADVRGEGIHLVVEAAPPLGRRRRRGWGAPALALAAAVVLAGGVLIAVGFERPRVVDASLVATPDGSLVGHWETIGSGSRTYDLRNAAGESVARGALTSPSGSMPLGRGEAATLHVAIANAFGSDARDAAYAHATAAPAIRIVATPPPRIESIAIERVRPGEPLSVRYAARAHDVRLAIVDRTGQVWFSTTTPSGSGRTQIPAPPAGPREPYTLIARAERDGAGEETRIPVAVEPAPTPAPSVSPAPSPEAGAGSAAADPFEAPVTGAQELTLKPEPVSPGQRFEVEVPFGAGAHVSIVRERDGVAVAAQNLPAGRRRATFVAPPVAAGPYSIRAVSERGAANLMLLHPLRYRGS